MEINKIVKVKQKKSKNTPFVSIEKVTEKLKGSDRTQLLHSIARWEFLRRNNEFKKEITTLKKKSENNLIKVFGEKTLDEEMEKKWTIVVVEKKTEKTVKAKTVFNQLTAEQKKVHAKYHPSIDWVYETKLKVNNLLNLDLSFQEIVQIIFKKKKYYKLKDGDIGSCLFFSSIVYNPTHLDEILEYDVPKDYEVYEYDSKGRRHITKEFKKYGLVVDIFDLKKSKNRLMKDFESMVDELKPHIQKIKKKDTKARKHHVFDLYPKYIKVYDMREKDKLKWREIADRVFPKEADSDNSETKVKQYFKEAKRLIKTVADF